MNECGECERDLRGGHDVECSRWAHFQLEMRNWGEECSPVQCAVVEFSELMEVRRRLARVTAERDKLQAENARLRHLMLWARDEDLPPAAGGDWDAFCEMDAEYNAACGYVPPCHGDEFCCCPQCAVLRGEVPGA